MSDYKDPVIEAVEMRLQDKEEHLSKCEEALSAAEKDLAFCKQRQAAISHEIATMRGFLRVYNPEAPGATTQGQMVGNSQAALSNIEPTPDASRPIVTGCVFLGLPPKGYLSWQDWFGAERKEGVTLMASDPSAPISWSYRNTHRN